METFQGQYFISYNREDQQRIRHIIGLLMQKGVNIWWDQGLKPESEDGWAKQISNQMKKSNACILFITEHIFTKAQSGVYREYEKAKFFNKNIIYVMLDDLNDDRVRELDENSDYTDWWIEIRKKHIIEGFKEGLTYEKLTDIIVNAVKDDQRIPQERKIDSPEPSSQEKEISQKTEEKEISQKTEEDLSIYIKTPKTIKLPFFFGSRKKGLIEEHAAIVREQLQLFEIIFDKTGDVRLLMEGSTNLNMALEDVHKNNVLWKSYVDTKVHDCMDCIHMIHVNLLKNGEMNDNLRDRIREVIHKTHEIVELLLQ